MAKDESFLSRWSRRKRQGEPEPDLEPVELPPVEASSSPAPDQDGDALAEVEDAITPEELERLPRIEEITAATDIRQFLRRGVPRALRNAALRRKWLTTPSIRDHKDCAVDYAWDWNTPGGVPGDGFISRESATRLYRAMTDPVTAGNRQVEAKAAEDAAPAHLVADSPNSTEQAPEETPREAGEAEVVDGRADRQDIAREDQSAMPSSPRRHGGALPS